ncbi:Phytocyanin domain [Dillenia turbinata]|uniref:Phytocyanin domain n=1 Tax=Dillenia turbinata TaxID=194707 RepID=A0AAN8WDW8_9MAGN
MEQREWRSGQSLVIVIVSVIAVSVSGGVEAYKNYTVGDSLGWFDNQEKPTVNYQKWAAPKNFSLGDFLIFNTDTNHSVIQTYNFTTYKHCDYYDAQDNDTIQWSAGDPSSTTPHDVSVPVPLVKEGMNYFFSGDYDGDQCRHGQHFKINVTYGQGLPESLKNPADESPAPTSPDSGDDESAPDTIVPSSFNHPQQEASDLNESSGSSLSMKLLECKKLNGIFILLVVIRFFIEL